MKNPERTVEEIVEESSKRLMAFEHEPSYWNGMMVYEAGDIEGYHDWLTQTLQTERQKREEMVKAERERILKAYNDVYHSGGGRDAELQQRFLEAITQPNNK